MKLKRLVLNLAVLVAASGSFAALNFAAGPVNVVSANMADTMVSESEFGETYHNSTHKIGNLSDAENYVVKWNMCNKNVPTKKIKPLAEIEGVKSSFEKIAAHYDNMIALLQKIVDSGVISKAIFDKYFADGYEHFTEAFKPRFDNEYFQRICGVLLGSNDDDDKDVYDAKGRYLGEDGNLHNAHGHCDENCNFHNEYIGKRYNKVRALAKQICSSDVRVVSDEEIKNEAVKNQPKADSNPESAQNSSAVNVAEPDAPSVEQAKLADAAPSENAQVNLANSGSSIALQQQNDSNSSFSLFDGVSNENAQVNLAKEDSSVSQQQGGLNSSFSLFDYAPAEPVMQPNRGLQVNNLANSNSFVGGGLANSFNNFGSELFVDDGLNRPSRALSSNLKKANNSAVLKRQQGLSDQQLRMSIRNKNKIRNNAVNFFEFTNAFFAGVEWLGRKYFKVTVDSGDYLNLVDEWASSISSNDFDQNDEYVRVLVKNLICAKDEFASSDKSCALEFAKLLKRFVLPIFSETGVYNELLQSLKTNSVVSDGIVDKVAAHFESRVAALADLYDKALERIEKIGKENASNWSASVRNKKQAKKRAKRQLSEEKKSNSSVVLQGGKVSSDKNKIGRKSLKKVKKIKDVEE